MERAQIAYEAYCTAAGGVAANGQPFPLWADLVAAGSPVVTLWRSTMEETDPPANPEPNPEPPPDPPPVPVRPAVLDILGDLVGELTKDELAEVLDHLSPDVLGAVLHWTAQAAGVVADDAETSPAFVDALESLIAAIGPVAEGDHE